MPSRGRAIPVKTDTAVSTNGASVWRAAQEALKAARTQLAQAAPGITRQPAFDRLLQAQRWCTGVIHRWLAEKMALDYVQNPCIVLSLDVDGILESEEEFSSTTLVGASALRLLQLGGVSVVLNTARSLVEVHERVDQFRLLGGVAEMGAATWNGMQQQEENLLNDRATAALTRLRAALRSDPSVVLDCCRTQSVRASRIRDGRPAAISGADARRLLDENRLDDLTFWVASTHTDFVDRSVDKGTGIIHLQRELGLTSFPVAAMGDAMCDLPMLRLARSAFLPAATLPSYVAGRHQRLVRSRLIGDRALWDAACHLVPIPSLHRLVTEQAAALRLPEWVPVASSPTPSTSLLTRFAAALASMRVPTTTRHEEV
jgi:haloacid dehalogenase-like hydrolase